jgi:FAD/FMN-containing dehydrogenase
VGVKVLRSIKQTLDPTNVLNPDILLQS